MNNLIKAMVCVSALALMGFSEIANFQFTDLDGKTYDLYEELAKGKHILVHATGAN